MPRDLFDEALAAYLTQYVGLGLVFLGGLVLAIRSGELDLRSSYGRRYFGLLVAGYLGHALLHGFFQFIAPLF